jgi:hypothetical protein
VHGKLRAQDALRPSKVSGSPALSMISPAPTLSGSSTSLRNQLPNHRECGRTGIQRQFRSSGELHRQRLVLALFPPKATKIVPLLVSFHSGATQSGNSCPVSIERGGSLRASKRGPCSSDLSQLGDARCRCLARPDCNERRWRRTGEPPCCPSAPCCGLPPPSERQSIAEQLTT